MGFRSWGIVSEKGQVLSSSMLYVGRVDNVWDILTGILGIRTRDKLQLAKSSIWGLVGKHVGLSV